MGHSPQKGILNRSEGGETIACLIRLCNVERYEEAIKELIER